jgi:hypothetical protein
MLVDLLDGGCLLWDRVDRRGRRVGGVFMMCGMTDRASQIANDFIVDRYDNLYVF